MGWDSLLNDVLVILREGREPAALAVHERTLGALLRSMEASGHQRNMPVREMQAAVGGWTPLILSVLSGGPMRHSELRRIIDLISAEHEISQRVLTQKLRSLERDGMVIRHVRPGAAPWVDYALTERGRGLHERIEAFVRWSADHTEAILASRRAYDAQHGEPGGDGPCAGGEHNDKTRC